MLLLSSCYLRACAILSLLLMTLIPAFAIGPFDAVPTDHWAYEAVHELIKHGVSPANGTFRFTATSTRFEYAKFLAATLTDWVFRADNSPTGEKASKAAIAEADLNLLLKVNAEFKNELTAMGVDLDAAKREIAHQLDAYRMPGEYPRLRAVKRIADGQGATISPVQAVPRGPSSSNTTLPFPSVQASASTEAGQSGPISRDPFQFVPRTHWAYNAMKLLEKDAIIPSHFTDEEQTRFEFAQAIGWISGGVAPGGVRIVLCRFDAEALRMLSIEFKEELTMMGVDFDALRKEIASARNRSQGKLAHDVQLLASPQSYVPLPASAPPIRANWGDVCASGRIVGGSGEHSIGLEWDNPFYISKVILRLPQGFRVFDSSKLKTQYWRLERPVRRIDFRVPGVNLTPTEQPYYAGEWQNAYTHVGFRLGDSQTPKSPPFDDVPTDHWAYRAINLLVDHGIIQGYPPGTICCKPAMTRFEFAQAFARAWLKVEKGVKPDADANDKVTLAQSDVETLVELFDEFEDLLKHMDMDTNATRLQLAELWERFGDREDVLSREATPLDAWMLSFRSSQAASTGVKTIHCNLLTTKLQVIFPNVVPYGTEINVIGHSYPLQ
jgi:hypothetical protein